MHYATIKKHDVANGPGVRVSLFVSGCTHRCKGCFNREAWDFAYGQPFDESAANEVLDALAPDEGEDVVIHEPGIENAGYHADKPFLEQAVEQCLVFGIDGVAHVMDVVGAVPRGKAVKVFEEGVVEGYEL